ncbi:MAG: asparagine synthetase B, partial [Deltaproteobacteria bacterium]|nr:asparagine synthetase B [Deltaproteobacteria bacterium]
MCRITGIWSQDALPDLETLSIRMRDTLTKGGPDDAGVYVDNKENIALGHRRLTIIDLTETGHQPMSTYGGRFTIAYNGEVYNY